MKTDDPGRARRPKQLIKIQLLNPVEPGKINALYQSLYIYHPISTFGGFNGNISQAQQ